MNKLIIGGTNGLGFEIYNTLKNTSNVTVIGRTKGLISNFDDFIEFDLAKHGKIDLLIDELCKKGIYSEIFFSILDLRFEKYSTTISSNMINSIFSNSLSLFYILDKLKKRNKIEKNLAVTVICSNNSFRVDSKDVFYSISKGILNESEEVIHKIDDNIRVLKIIPPKMATKCHNYNENYHSPNNIANKVLYLIACQAEGFYDLSLNPTIDELIEGEAIKHSGNPLGTSNRALSVLKKYSYLYNGYKYNEEAGNKLYKKLSSAYNLDRRDIYIQIGGASRILYKILKAYKFEHQNIITFKPGFEEVGEWGGILGYSVKEFDLSEAFQAELYVKKLIKCINKNPRGIFYLINPLPYNNVYLTKENIIKILNLISSDSILILDETYQDWLSPNFIGYKDIFKLNRNPKCYKNNNLVSVKSLSKIHGLADFRVGYIFGCLDIINRLKTDELKFDIPNLFESMACQAIGDVKFINTTIDYFRREHVKFQKHAFTGIVVQESFTNILVLKKKRNWIAEELEKIKQLGFYPRLTNKSKNIIYLYLGKRANNKKLYKYLKETF